MIVWDDGSTDGTAEMVAAFNDSRVKYFHGDNHGPAYARNRAIEKATGELVAFIDSDDEWMETKLVDQAKVMQAYPQIDFLFTDFINIDEINGKTTRTFNRYSDVLNLLIVEYPSQHLNIVRDRFLQSISIENYLSPSTVMLRKRVFESNHGFNESLIGPEDFELWWRLGLAGIQIAYLDKVSTTRYKSSGSLSRLSYKNLDQWLKALEMCCLEALAENKPELAELLKPQFRNAWQNMILVYGVRGEIIKAFRAFRESLKYGFRFGSLRLLLKVLFRAR